MSRRPRRLVDNRLSNDVDPTVLKMYPTGILKGASADDKKKWQGFCEVESEPVWRSPAH